MALTPALKVLVDFAAAHVAECPPDQQIPIYQALAETLPDPGARQTARELGEALSRVSALQLDFQEFLAADNKA